jgi:hypothetical protein
MVQKDKEDSKYGKAQKKRTARGPGAAQDKQKAIRQSPRTHANTPEDQGETQIWLKQSAQAD